MKRELNIKIVIDTEKMALTKEEAFSQVKEEGYESISKYLDEMLDMCNDSIRMNLENNGIFTEGFGISYDAKIFR